MNNNKMKLHFLSVILLSSVGHAATTIDIVGSTTLNAGGEFADYSATTSGFGWGNSGVNDGTVGLSVSRTGFNSDVSSSFWNTSNYRGTGTEINFTKGSATASDAAMALTDKSFTAIKLDSTSFGSTTITLDTVAVSLWRNGTQAADVYQFAYDSTGNGYDASDFLGTAVTNTTSGVANTFTVSSTLAAMSPATQQEVRLYFWKQGTAGVNSANTHMFNVATTYTIPEPSTMGLLGLCTLGMLARRRR